MSRAILYFGSQLTRAPLKKKALRFISTADKQEKAETAVRSRWQRWVPIPTAIGVTVLAVLQWRRLHRRSQEQGSEIAEAKNWEITCYRAVPCRAFSRVWGWLSNRQLPSPLRTLVYKTYSSMYGVNLDEMAGDLKDYPSLAQFFTRKLKPDVRPIDFAYPLVSPADGKLLNCGKINCCHVEQIKGVTYKIQTFLGQPSWRPISKLSYVNNRKSTLAGEEVVGRQIKDTDENSNIVARQLREQSQVIGGTDLVRLLFRSKTDVLSQEREECSAQEWEDYKMRLLTNPENELYQAVVYLAPGDYHRFHSPAHWRVSFRRHFQGELLSVNPVIAGWIPELFSLNERVVYVGQWEHGFFSMTAVGATNVGSIKVYCDETLHTNTLKWRDGTRHKDQEMDVTWTKGEEVGEFNMGSTIVLIFEAPKDFKFNASPSQIVRVGQSLSHKLDSRRC